MPRNISDPFIRIVHRVGEGALDLFRKNENAFDVLDHDGLLTEFYSGEASQALSYHYYQQMLEQIVHRHPGMDVLEVGMYNESLSSTTKIDNYTRSGHSWGDTIIHEPRSALLQQLHFHGYFPQFLRVRRQRV